MPTCALRVCAVGLSLGDAERSSTRSVAVWPYIGTGAVVDTAAALTRFISEKQNPQDNPSDHPRRSILPYRNRFVVCNTRRRVYLVDIGIEGTASISATNSRVALAYAIPLFAQWRVSLLIPIRTSQST